MTDISIPGWALIVFGAIFIPWLVYLTNKVNANEKAIDVNTATDLHVKSELTRIYDAIEKMDKKLDAFVAQEMAFLKHLVK